MIAGYRLDERARLVDNVEKKEKKKIFYVFLAAVKNILYKITRFSAYFLSQSSRALFILPGPSA